MPGTEERVAFISGCRDCGAVFINPRPESDTLKSCYAPDGEWARNRAVSEQTRDETLRALKVERLALRLLGLIVGNHLVPAKLWTLAAGQASSWTPSQNAAGIVPESTQQRLPSSHGIECSTPFLKPGSSR